MKVEIWKDIENFSKYQVSNLGNVKSKDRYTKAKDDEIIHRKEFLLKGFINKKGYKQLTLYDDNGKPKTLRVHKLVALTFIEKNDMILSQKDIDKEELRLTWKYDKEFIMQDSGFEILPINNNVVIYEMPKE